MIKIPIYIEKLYKYNLSKEPCYVAVPFKRGVLNEDRIPFLKVSDNNGNSVPSAIRPTAIWDDGSVKYLFVRMAPDIPANKNITLNLSESDACERKPQEKQVNITCENNSISVSTGAISFDVFNDADMCIGNVKRGNSENVLLPEQFVGPVLKVSGNEMVPHINAWEIVESSPLCCVLEGHGAYSNGSLIDIQIKAYAGKEYVEFGFKLTNASMQKLVPEAWKFYVKKESGSIIDDSLEGEYAVKLDSTGCADKDETKADTDTLFFKTTGTAGLLEIENGIRENSTLGIRTFTGISNYKTKFEISGEGKALSKAITKDLLISEANEHFAEVFYGTFMADVCDKAGGVCATVFQAQQNFPKAIKATKDGLCIYLIPEGREKVCFSSGMAREQKILLHFHDEETPIEELDNRSLIYQMPVSPFVDPMEFMEAGVFPNIVTPIENRKDHVEISLIDKADHHGRAYGMMNFGDFPDANYTAQGRGGGRLVWTNNEYDYPHAMFMMYARTGVRRFLDYGKVSAWHWMDVDVCHYSENPLLIGGQWEHTACHNGGDVSETGVEGVMVCSHEWVEGLLDLWHFTGDKRALDTALGIGENILRLLDTPMYQKAGEANARETGWALRTLTALYLETYDEKWTKKCEWIIKQFEEWYEKYGAWLAPYTDNTVIRIGFMISVAVGSLMRYYRVFPTDSVKKMIIASVDDLIENGMTPNNIFYYKELPSLRRNGNNTLLLESMYIGYELTGDVKYLKAGIRTFEASIASKEGYDSKKRVEEDAVLVGNASPKGFAQSFLPLTQFYNAIAKEGLI